MLLAKFQGYNTVPVPTATVLYISSSELTDFLTTFQFQDFPEPDDIICWAQCEMKTQVPCSKIRLPDWRQSNSKPNRRLLSWTPDTCTGPLVPGPEAGSCLEVLTGEPGSDEPSLVLSPPKEAYTDLSSDASHLCPTQPPGALLYSAALGVKELFRVVS